MAETEETFYTDVEDEDDFKTVELASDRVRLRSGEAMDSAAVERFLLGRPARRVAIIGEALSGKTTLVCALYDRFLKGPFAGFCFAGSKTILGLERRSHYSRVESGYSSPETERTSFREDLLHYHFALTPVDATDQRPGHLLLSDRAGESYQTARSKTDEISALPELHRSDRIVILLDGSKVADRIERSGAMQNARQLIQAFLDNDALGAGSRVQLVITKQDMVERAVDADVLKGRLSDFYQRLSADFSPRLKQLTFSKISARDPTGSYAVGWGVDDLLTAWMEETAVGILRTRPDFLTPSSEMDRLLLRTRLQDWP